MERITDRVGYVPGGVNVGVIRLDDGSALMVDTGGNESNGLRALKTIRTGGLEVAGILTTHAHADHFGGNAAVVGRTGAAVWAPDIDEAIVRHPELLPTLLFGGAAPPAPLRGRFLLAMPSPVDHVVTAGPLAIEGVMIEVVPLPGHSPGQVGYLIDGVFFCADIVLPPEALEKHPVPYLVSVGKHLESLARAEAVPCDLAVPGHGSVMADIGPSVAANRAVVERLLAAVTGAVSIPLGFAGVMNAVRRTFGFDVTEPAGYYLVQSSVYAALAHLEDGGVIRQEINANAPTWVQA
ncbi:MAG: MBL fold metallo-hydrolase [Thermomicrobiales bacterium]